MMLNRPLMGITKLLRDLSLSVIFKLETTNLTANHELLRNIAAQNGGNFYAKNQIDQLKDDLLE
jgi:hypothetical protein